MLREGEVRLQSGPALTEYTYTGQYSYAGSFGLMYYNARWYDPYLKRFAQADSIVPPGVQGLDRYAYVNNSPMNYVDPSGHFTCSNDPNNDDYCPNHLPSGAGGDRDDIPIWSTGKFKNENVGKLLSDLSTKLQYAATFFSDIGAASEIGLTTGGLLFGSGILGWADGFVPVADVSAGLAGGVVGWEVGHAIHKVFTNPIETSLSTASARATYLSDIFLGNNRIDVYENNIKLVIGQPTATTGVLATTGRISTIGITDAIIDEAGKLYADGKLPGVYDAFNATGNEISIFSTVTPGSLEIHSWLDIQLGDD